MPILNPQELEGVSKPELVFGLVAAVGTPLELIMRVLKDALEQRAYTCETIRLSNYMEGLQLPGKKSKDADCEYEKISILMDRGNALRQQTGGGEALALLAAAYINSLRPDRDPRFLDGKAFLIRQLKHPDEVVWFRRIYGDAFHLIGVYSPAHVREVALVTKGLRKEEAKRLIERDEGEEERLGQQLARTFHLADVFVEYRSHDDGNEMAMHQVLRFVKLLFGEGVETPSRDEYGMCLAQVAAMRSADLARQVGAAILSPLGEVIAVGTNDVPCFGGGQYWGENSDARDFKRGFDANTKKQRECLAEVVAAFTEGWGDLDQPARNAAIDQWASKLAGARLMNLTEFGRAVHAEMEAILAAGRLGVPLREADLYTTTFPCHNCAKHIIGAGIKRVVYVEPYPKSLAHELHSDALAFPEDVETNGRVLFEPFVGIAPRKFADLFSVVTPEGRLLSRKGADGDLTQVPWGLRIGASPYSYIDRESIAAVAAQKIGEMTG